MPKPRPSRRDILKSAAALPFVYAAPLRAAAPRAEAITPLLIAAATKEGQLTWHTSADLQLAEEAGKIFEQKVFGIRVRVERVGGERIFSRIAQEYSPGLHFADAVSTGDAAQFLAWKRQGMLAIRDGKAKLSRSAIKVWKEDPTAVETQGEEIKRHYSQIFRL